MIRSDLLMENKGEKAKFSRDQGNMLSGRPAWISCLPLRVGCRRPCQKSSEICQLNNKKIVVASECASR